MTTDNKLVLGGDNPSMKDAYNKESDLFNEDGTLKEVIEPTGQVDEKKIDEVKPEDVITIPRSKLQAEIDRLRIEDADFAQVYNRDIGNKAAARYKPEIDSLRKQNEALQLSVRQSNYSKLTEEEVNTKFKTDPTFAADYARVVHAPAPQLDDVPAINPIEVATAVNNTLAFAEQILTKEQADQFRKNVVDGKYDIDESGTPYSTFAWREGLERLQRDIVNLSRPKVETKVEETKVVQPQIKLDTSQPDMSNGGGRGTQRQTFTLQQVREMDINEKIRRWPRDGDIEKAIDSGEIVIPT